jgi:hypothetical protein
MGMVTNKTVTALKKDINIMTHQDEVSVATTSPWYNDITCPTDHSRLIQSLKDLWWLKAVDRICTLR